MGTSLARRKYDPDPSQGAKPPPEVCGTNYTSPAGFYFIKNKQNWKFIFKKEQIDFMVSVSGESSCILSRKSLFFNVGLHDFCLFLVMEPFIRFRTNLINVLNLGADDVTDACVFLFRDIFSFSPFTAESLCIFSLSWLFSLPLCINSKCLWRDFLPLNGAHKLVFANLGS